jgi:hypothetical protein
LSNRTVDTLRENINSTAPTALLSVAINILEILLDAYEELVLVRATQHRNDVNLNRRMAGEPPAPVTPQKTSEKDRQSIFDRVRASESVLIRWERLSGSLRKCQKERQLYTTAWLCLCAYLQKGTLPPGLPFPDGIPIDLRLPISDDAAQHEDWK